MRIKLKQPKYIYSMHVMKNLKMESTQFAKKLQFPI